MDCLSREKIHELSELAYQIRKVSLEMIAHAGWGHIGGSFSQAELLACLYGYFLKIDPANPNAENRDYFILSKAHGSPALYAALGLKGFYPIDKIYSYCRLGGLEGHTDMLETPGIEMSGGSLGLGLSYAVGVALGLKMKENFHQRVYCMMGDGEQNEGQIWEAAMSAVQYELFNLIAIIDYNKVMAKGFVKELMSIQPLTDKWRSFGWNVIEVDGHDVKDICNALYRAKYIEVNGKPTCIIAHTVKGKGVDECEFNYKWHTHAPSIEEAQRFMDELAKRYGKGQDGFQKLPAMHEERGLETILRGEIE